MDMGVAPSPPAVTRMSLRQHIRRTMALAVPVMLARAGLIIMMTVGTVMVGQAGRTSSPGSPSAWRRRT
jgi:Na+-driven multidrug efflux pump